LQLNDCAMDLRRDVFQAIADPTRRAILILVATQAMTPGAIAKNFDATRQTISKHIQILTECELLTQEQQGREILYRFNPQKMKEVADWVEPYRKLWEEKLDSFEAYLAQLQSK
jgi:DNA-binding transcriptional ArsR family regulator